VVSDFLRGAISQKRREIALRLQLITIVNYMQAFDLCKVDELVTTLNSQNAYAITGNQKIIWYGHNVRLMLYFY